MNRKFQLLILLALISLISFCFTPGTSAQSTNSSSSGNLIQMAILLDTSSSMDGLIDQAKSQLWKVVNELARAKQNGRTPRLEVSLYEYGKSSIPEEAGYIRQLLPFTTDLDQISEVLFQLTTDGGDEYCGQVILNAVNHLKWSKNTNDFKVIFIAGNEPFTQGTFDYRGACKSAITKGITVNTIFCGTDQEGIDTNWKDGADRAEGAYLSIDQNQEMVQISAPQDAEILKLSQELNLTYLAYGTDGATKKERQEVADSNAAEMGASTAVQRSAAKSSTLYVNTGWDLVDLVIKEGFKVLDTLKEEDFPPELRGLTKEERIKIIQEKIKLRRALQQKITKLNEARNLYLEKAQKNTANQNSLDKAIIQAIHRQAAKKNYKFK